MSEMYPVSEVRGILRAYVSANEVTYQHDIGTMSFHEIYVNTPVGVRYVVVEVYHTEHAPDFVVYDLWQAREKGNSVGYTKDILPPEDKYNKTYRDLDVAIAATVLTYGKDTMGLIPYLQQRIDYLIQHQQKERQDNGIPNQRT